MSLDTYAGDDRVNEHSGLMALQTIYHRYHNVIEEKLFNINPHWSGERLFQVTFSVYKPTVGFIKYGWLLLPIPDCGLNMLKPTASVHFCG